MAWFIAVLLALYAVSFFSTKPLTAFTPAKTQPLRGVLAVLIVAFHLSHIPPADAALGVVYRWGASVVALFFFISGFGLTRQFGQRGRAYLSGFWMHRIVRGVLVSWLLAYVLFVLLVRRSPWSLADAVAGLLATGETTLPYSWYVFVILCLYVGFYVCGRFLPVRWLASALTLWSVALMVAMAVAGWERCWYVSTLAFPVGVWYARVEARLLAFFTPSPGWAYRAVVPVLLVVAGVLYWSKAEWAYALLYGLLPLMVAVPFMRVKAERLGAWRPVVWLSGVSYEVYLCQGIAFGLARRFLPAGTGAFVWIVAAFSLTLVLAWMVHAASRAVASAGAGRPR